MALYKQAFLRTLRTFIGTRSYFDAKHWRFVAFLTDFPGKQAIFDQEKSNKLPVTSSSAAPVRVLRTPATSETASVFSRSLVEIFRQVSTVLMLG
uniref:Uncharacterized protein n=1 Tax=Romanomermis culicivorax TaxID=13658 RepID=A0A915HZR8_ROMCU